MYRLLYNGEEHLYATLEAALEDSRTLYVEWAILDPKGAVAFDWTDRVGP